MNTLQKLVCSCYIAGAALNGLLLFTILYSKLVRHPVVLGLLGVIFVRAFVALTPFANIDDLDQYLSPAALILRANPSYEGPTLDVERWDYLVRFCIGQGAVAVFFVALTYGFTASFSMPILGVALASRSAPEPTDNWEYVPKKWYELSPLCLCVVPFVWAVPVLLVPLIGLAMTDSNIPGLNSSTQYDISPVVFMDTFCMHTSYVYGLTVSIMVIVPMFVSVVLAFTVLFYLIQMHREHHIAFNRPGLDKASIARWIAMVIIVMISITFMVVSIVYSKPPFTHYVTAWESIMPTLQFFVFATQQDVMLVWRKWAYLAVGKEPPQVQTIDSWKSRLRWDMPWNTSFMPQIRQSRIRAMYQGAKTAVGRKNLKRRSSNTPTSSRVHMSPQPSIEEEIETPTSTSHLTNYHAKSGQVTKSRISSVISPLALPRPPTPSRSHLSKRPTRMPPPSPPYHSQSTPLSSFSPNSEFTIPTSRTTHVQQPKSSVPLFLYNPEMGDQHSTDPPSTTDLSVHSQPQKPRTKIMDPLTAFFVEECEGLRSEKHPLHSSIMYNNDRRPSLPNPRIESLTSPTERRPSLPTVSNSKLGQSSSSGANLTLQTETIVIPDGLSLPPFAVAVPPTSPLPPPPDPFDDESPSSTSPRLRPLSFDTDIFLRLSPTPSPARLSQELQDPELGSSPLPNSDRSGLG